jgi:hypothetical protein
MATTVWRLEADRGLTLPEQKGGGGMWEGGHYVHERRKCLFMGGENYGGKDCL